MPFPTQLLIAEESVENASALLEILHFVGETADAGEVEKLKGSLLTLLTQTQLQLGQARRSIRNLYSITGRPGGSSTTGPDENP